MGEKRVRAWIGLGVLIGALSATTVALVQAQQYAGQTIFSASDADVGRTQGALDSLSLGLNRYTGMEAFDSSKYYEGRFSNGITYAEILPGKLGYPYEPETNFAWGGAATGPYALTLPVANDNNLAAIEDFLAAPTADKLAALVETIVTEVPELGEDPTLVPVALVFQLVPGQHSMSTQVDEYLAENPTTPSDRLYMIGPAYNDYYAYHQRDPSVPAQNQEQMMSRLYDAGARDFAIFAYGGETDFGHEYSAEIVERSNRFQREHPGSKVYVVDFDGALAEIKRDPGRYGFSDNFTPCFTDGLYLDACPDDRLYYDSVHPTRTGHEAVANLYYATIASGYQGPRQFAQLPEMGRLAALGPQREIAARVDRSPAGSIAGQSTAGAAAGATAAGGLDLWLQVGFSFGSRSDNPLAQDFDYTGAHLVAGIDHTFENQATLGLAASFSGLSAEYGGVGGESEVYAYGLTAYGGWKPGRLGLAAQAGYAFNQYRDVARATGFPQRPVATGSPDGDTLFASLAATLDLVLDDLTLIPRLALVYARTTVDAFQEEGSVLFDFRVAGQEVDSLRSQVAIAAERPLALPGFGASTVRLSLGWEHEFEDGAREVLGTFPNGSEQFVQSDFGTPDAVLVGLALSFAFDQLKPGTAARIAYDGRFGDDGNDQLFTVAVRLPLN